mgnify:CR=1 FL=1
MAVDHPPTQLLIRSHGHAAFSQLVAMGAARVAAAHFFPAADDVPHFSQHRWCMCTEVCDGDSVAEEAFELVGQPELCVGEVEWIAEEAGAMAVQPVERDHIGIGMLRQKCVDRQPQGIGNPVLIDIDDQAMGGGGLPGGMVVKASIGGALLTASVGAVGVDQMDLGVVGCDGLNDRAGLAGAVVVESDEQVAEALSEVVVDEFSDLGTFVGGDADHIAAVRCDGLSLQKASGGPFVAAAALLAPEAFALEVVELLAKLRCLLGGEGGEHRCDHRFNMGIVFCAVAKGLFQSMAQLHRVLTEPVAPDLSGQALWPVELHQATS